MTTTTAFGIAIALGACLLFQIQFLLAKLILPWFGGSPSVWSTSLVVFQALLLAGYAYAHGLSLQPTRARQLTRHVALIAIACAVLAWRAWAWPAPVTPGADWKPNPDGSPVWQIIVLLAGAVGLPFLLLASTSPLLQRWYADMAPGRSPYRLYALSNLGSLAGLVTYPLLVEPRLDVYQQGRWWTAAFGVYVAATLVCAWLVRGVEPDRRTRPAATPAPEAAAGVELHGGDGERGTRPAPTPAAEDVAATPSPIEQLLWLLLAAVPSALLQSTTTRLTQDVAAVPFLWMLPLALYLLTFILAFEYPRAYRRHVLTIAVVAAAVAAIPEWPVRWSIPALLLMLTVCGLSMHGELAARAPHPRWLTRFYLIVSAGGVLGSALVALGAPLIFDGIVEYPLTLMAAALVLGAVYLVHARQPGVAVGEARGARMLALGLALMAAVIAGQTARQWFGLTRDAVYASRNFFGAIRVREGKTSQGDAYRRLVHGTTAHGQQFLSPGRSREAVSYYTATSGIGQVMRRLHTQPEPLRVGVLGLGTGTLAAFSRTADNYTFFEIDPQVVALSTASPPLFRYLTESAGRITIVGGDGRLSLERALPYRFDVLAIDAFSSDSVPVHLITREAFALYARHLRNDQSILAVHVSNRYLDLQHIVHAAGALTGFTVVQVDDETHDEVTDRTTWMLLAADPRALAPYGTPLNGDPGAPWTDASSNLLGVLRW